MLIGFIGQGEKWVRSEETQLRKTLSNFCERYTATVSRDPFLNCDCKRVFLNGIRTKYMQASTLFLICSSKSTSLNNQQIFAI